jgi:hypothetical protein
MKNIPKYYFILLGNMVILKLLVLYWTSDCLVTYYSKNQSIYEIYKILGISILAWYTMRKFEKYSSKIRINKTEEIKKIILAVLIVTVFSSYKYIEYSKKIIAYKITHSELRENVCQKLSPHSDFIKSEGAENLSFSEYQEIKSLTPLPEIPKEADSINYSYVLFDDFLGDYTFVFWYVVPLEIDIDTSSIKKMSYSQSQYYEIKNNLKYVRYFERKT